MPMWINVNVVETNHDQLWEQLCICVRVINEVKQDWVTSVLFKKKKANVYNRDRDFDLRCNHFIRHLDVNFGMYLLKNLYNFSNWEKSNYCVHFEKKKFGLYLDWWKRTERSEMKYNGMVWNWAEW